MAFSIIHIKQGLTFFCPSVIYFNDIISFSKISTRSMSITDLSPTFVRPYFHTSIRHTYYSTHLYRRFCPYNVSLICQVSISESDSTSSVQPAERERAAGRPHAPRRGRHQPGGRPQTCSRGGRVRPHHFCLLRQEKLKFYLLYCEPLYRKDFPYLLCPIGTSDTYELFGQGLWDAQYLYTADK